MISSFIENSQDKDYELSFLVYPLFEDNLISMNWNKGLQWIDGKWFIMKWKLESKFQKCIINGKKYSLG